MEEKPADSSPAVGSPVSAPSTNSSVNQPSANLSVSSPTGPSPAARAKHAPNPRLAFIIALAALAVVALVSLVSIGILTWQSANKTAEIDDLKAEVLSSYRKNWAGNPILEAADSSREYEITLTVHGDSGYLDLAIEKGAVSDCYYVKNGIGGSECSINGLEGSIYKVQEIAVRPDDPERRYLAFIMADGSVPYIPIAEAFSTDNWDIRGTLTVEKPVVDIVEVIIKPQASTVRRKGYLIVFNDSSFVEFTSETLED